MIQLKTKVAIVGASGIGKHHAKWYNLVECDVVAFVGTSRRSTQNTASVLHDLFGFQGVAYWDVDEMLNDQKPDIVGVCSPYRLHKEHTLKSLEAGACVLCEKPLTWDRNKSFEQILSDGEEMVRSAEEKALTVGVSTQYVALPRNYKEIYEREVGNLENIERFYVELESRGDTVSCSYEDILVDLMPHALSLLLTLMPDGKIDPQTLSCTVKRTESITEFDWVGPQGGATTANHATSPWRCSVEIMLRKSMLRNRTDGELRRKFGVNGFIVDIGAKDVGGVYKSVLNYGGKDEVFDDLLHMLIFDFVKSVTTEEPEIPSVGERALKNMRLQVEILRSKLGDGT